MSINDPHAERTLASLHTLVGAHAVSALDPQEQERFEQNLDQCPDC